jgi:hypothetical protein
LQDFIPYRIAKDGICYRWYLKKKAGKVHQVDPNDNENNEEPIFEDFSTEPFLRKFSRRSSTRVSRKKKGGQLTPENPIYPADTPVTRTSKKENRAFIDTIVFDTPEIIPKVSPAKRNAPVPKTSRAEKTPSGSPSKPDQPEPETYRITETSYVSTGESESPDLIIDTTAEPSFNSPPKREPLRLIITMVEETPSGYIVHHNEQKSITSAVETSQPAEDKTMSILAGCGVIVCILLMAVLATIAPLLTGTGAVGGTPPALAIAGVSGAVVGQDPFTSDSQFISDGADLSPDPAPDPGTVDGPGWSVPDTAPGLFTNAGTSLMNGDAPAPELVGVAETGTAANTATSKSYVTLQPVPDSLTPPPRDIRADLPVPVTDDYFTIYSMDCQPAQQNIPYVLFDLANPPLVIDYSVSPLNVTDVKELDYKIMATEHHENVSVSRPYEQSWFSVIVRDNVTGNVVLEDGYGKTYTQQPAKQLVLYKGGKYRFEFSGGSAVVNLTMKVKKEGNIE